MARPADPNSKRQRAFKVLDGMRDAERKVAIAAIKVELNLKQGTADTIYATHRQMGMDAGLYTTTYRILEKNGKPYVSSHVVFEPEAGAFTSVEDAKFAYLDALAKKIEVVTTL